MFPTALKSSKSSISGSRSSNSSDVDSCSSRSKSSTVNGSCRFLSGERKRRRNASNNILTFLMMLLLLGECSSSPSTSSSSSSSSSFSSQSNEGAPSSASASASASSSSSSSSLTALYPINTRPTGGVEAEEEEEEAVSHTSPQQPLLHQSYTPLHAAASAVGAVAAPLLQDTPGGGGRRALQDADQGDAEEELYSTSTTTAAGGFNSDPLRRRQRQRSLALSTTPSPSLFLPSQPPHLPPSPSSPPSAASLQSASQHQTPYRYQSSTSVRLLKASSLRQGDTRAMPSYVMKEYLPSGKMSRVLSSSTHLSSPSHNKDPAKSALPKKSFLLQPHHPPPYPVPPRPPSSPPPLVPLWPDPPPPPPPPYPSPNPFPQKILFPPPPTPVQDVLQSSTVGSINQPSRPEGRKKKVGKDDDIPRVREKHSRIPGVPKGAPKADDSAKQLGIRSASIVHMRSNNLYSGRDKNVYFLRRSEFFDQERMRPVSDGGGYPQYQQHMDEQNYPEPPPFNYDIEPAVKESVTPRKEDGNFQNTRQMLTDRINMTKAFRAQSNYPLDNWDDQHPENLPFNQSPGEEESLGEYSKSELDGAQLREEGSMGSMQEKQRRKEVKGIKFKGQRQDGNLKSAIMSSKNNYRPGAFRVDRLRSSYTNEPEGDKKSDKRISRVTSDVANASSLTGQDYDNETTGNVNEVTTEAQQKVNLEKLEMELSKKDEEAASDLLLAISILQHHMIPSLQKDEENEAKGKAVNTSRASDGSTENHQEKDTKWGQHHYHHYNIEILDSQSSSSSSEVGSENEEDEEEGNGHGGLSNKGLTEDKPNGTVVFQPVHEVPLLPEHQACYRWFVLVLDGNCSVIKQRMSAFVIFLKAALSSKLSIDYNDVYVPSVFCDNTFMVNISLDTIKNPQAEIKLRLLAEANTTLLEISEEIFYLEKILTKRADDDGQDMQPLVKKPDDVELVIYIAVGCMVVFILLSVVIVALIRVCRQEGDQMDIGKTIPHQPLQRPFDFPIRRPNVIYSHRFSQALIPDKCTSTPSNRVENNPSSGGRGSIGVMAVTGSGRGSVLRYDTQFAGELMIGDEDFYSMGSAIDDSFNDRRALVPSRRRTTKVPGEDVIMEEDIVEEEEEEDLEDDDEEEEDDDVDEEPDDDVTEEKNKVADVSREGARLSALQDRGEVAERCHFHISGTMKDVEACRPTPKESKVPTKENLEIKAGNKGRLESRNAVASFVTGNAKPDALKSEPNKSRPRAPTHSFKPSDARPIGEGAKEATPGAKPGNTSNVTGGTVLEDTAGTRTNEPSTKDTPKRSREEENTTSSGRAAKASSRAKELLGSRLRGRRNLRPGYEVVFKGIDNPCYNR
ncbi:uncharacterized protein [Macrobrachium rosenbergii]|uniref:uncharacterized protein n=1 Tax=Macrobrachium rosenbergii TaxID=79674 RepID=UPI0034D3B9A5